MPETWLGSRGRRMNFRDLVSCADRLKPRSLVRGAAVVSLLVLFVPFGVAAQNAGPTIALSDADRTQLDALLGKGVVGEALPSAPLKDPDSYLPRHGRTLTYQVVVQGGKPAIE